MLVPLRPPSVAWEPLALRGDPGGAAWVWFHPAAAPWSVQYQIPAETVQRLGPALTVELLIASSGLPPQQLQGWEANGRSYDVDAGAWPLIGQPIPADGGSPVLVQIRLRGVAAAPPLAAILPPAAPSAAGVDSDRAWEGLEADWLAIELVERQLDAVRKQLSAMQGRLQPLNRDLSPEEFRAADNQDRKDWIDARRWLRIAGDQLGRYIREYDIGAVSGAGGRHRFEELYRNHIQPRRPFAGLAAARLEFEQYRKTHQTLLLQMQAVLANAQRDGEQRAQQLLNRIAAKVRTARGKR